MEEALQSGKTEIAEYLAPRTILEDDKTYSTIPEVAIYKDARGEDVDEEDEDEEDEDEEEKKSLSDNRSLQSEEAIRPDDY